MNGVTSGYAGAAGAWWESRILLVASDASERVRLTGVLDRLGMRVKEVVTFEGIESACGLVSADLALVVASDGCDEIWDVPRRIQESSQRFWGHSPAVVGMMRLFHRSLRNRCISAGFADYLQSPAEDSRVVRAVARWIDRRVVIVVAGGSGTESAAMVKLVRDCGIPVRCLTVANDEQWRNLLQSARVSGVICCGVPARDAPFADAGPWPMRSLVGTSAVRADGVYEVATEAGGIADVVLAESVESPEALRCWLGELESRRRGCSRTLGSTSSARGHGMEGNGRAVLGQTLAVEVPRLRAYIRRAREEMTSGAGSVELPEVLLLAAEHAARCEAVGFKEAADACRRLEESARIGDLNGAQLAVNALADMTDATRW